MCGQKWWIDRWCSRMYNYTAWSGGGKTCGVHNLNSKLPSVWWTYKISGTQCVNHSIMCFASSYNSLFPLSFQPTVLYSLTYRFTHLFTQPLLTSPSISCPFWPPHPHIFLASPFFRHDYTNFQTPSKPCHSPPHVLHTYLSERVVVSLLLRNREVPCLILATDANNSVGVFVIFLDSFLISMEWCLKIRLNRLWFYPLKFISRNNNPIRVNVVEKASLGRLKHFADLAFITWPAMTSQIANMFKNLSAPRTSSSSPYYFYSQDLIYNASAFSLPCFIVHNTVFLKQKLKKKQVTNKTRAVPWLRRLVAGLSPRRHGFDPGSVHVGFVVDNVALGQVSPRVLRFSPVNFIPPVLNYLEKWKKKLIIFLFIFIARVEQ
jgi:hypothetical protein